MSVTNHNILVSQTLHVIHVGLLTSTDSKCTSDKNCRFGVTFKVHTYLLNKLSGLCLEILFQYTAVYNVEIPS